ncbi:RNA polymerase [Nesterenkonia sp. AN1]|uniref:sigma-70 family RNA polymerase sigma factor n=1 Tax=Nesterenkonia sp. AN1 TaxID=652017 RepID=UPI000445F5F2|nr:sigma-70 family RNA polymerase sigma factor [Nesterenkonia sp. AN1]EXF25307.1 RNA polymerase [Nesterenkonia sp. AN1]
MEVAERMRTERHTTVAVPSIESAYDQHSAALFGFAANALQDHGAAEECVQETFVRAWQALDRFDPARSSLRNWLFAIARNVVRDEFRARRRIPIPMEPEITAPEASDLNTTDPTETMLLVEALGMISLEHSQSVIAVHVLGFTYAELSESLQVPVTTLRTRTYYGLRALRRAMEEMEAES